MIWVRRILAALLAVITLASLGFGGASLGLSNWEHTRHTLGSVQRKI